MHVFNYKSLFNLHLKVGVLGFGRASISRLSRDPGKSKTSEDHRRLSQSRGYPTVPLSATFTTNFWGVYRAQNSKTPDISAALNIEAFNFKIREHKFKKSKNF
jgi:hypothetical protein